MQNLAQQNGIRSLHSLNGIEWHSLVTLAEWQMRLSLSTPWSALPLNVIKGISPNAI